MKKKLDNIARDDGRYSLAMMKFVNESLSYTVRNMADEPGHVTGQLLCEGLKKLALEKWGRLAKLVLNSGGVMTTSDIGEIVYLMIENQWMSSRATDSIDDFNDIYDFETVFKKQFTFKSNKKD